MGKRKSNNQHGIAVEVVVGSHHLLHLVPGGGVQVDVARLEVLEGVAGNHWDLIPSAFHGWLEILDQRAG
jgi:hypothetical protein